MPPHPRSSLLFRMARRIQNRIVSARRSRVPLPPESTWDNLCRICRHLAIAEAHGWNTALQRLHRDYRSVASHLVRQVQVDLEMFDEPNEPPAPSDRDILADLTALETEFDRVEVDVKEGTVSAVTERIVLEGIDLGPFKILLRIDRIDGGAAYDVMALEPNPAAGSSHPHPHVSDETLCEGDGRRAIEAALEQGRIFDLFVLVRQILQTYNPRSAYVSLSRWNGRECRDCGTIASEDESTCCERCDAEICCDCGGCCNACHITCCSSCRSRCPECDDDVCDRCSRSCSGCEELFCPGCLDDGRCPVCRREEESSHATDQETPETAENAPDSLASILAHGLGEVPVPA